jgi:hypothetical protein
LVIELGEVATLEANAFYHRYDQMQRADANEPRFTRSCVFDGEIVGADSGCVPFAAPDPLRIDAHSEGLEVFLRRAISERVSGFASYTLARVRGAYEGLERPTYDTRHQADIALRVRPTPRWQVGARLHARSGRPARHTAAVVDAEYRVTIQRHTLTLPPFARLDLQASYSWPTSFGAMTLTTEWVNVTFAREPVGAACSNADGIATGCEPTYAPRMVLPSIGLRAEF